MIHPRDKLNDISVNDQPLYCYIDWHICVDLPLLISSHSIDGRKEEGSMAWRRLRSGHHDTGICVGQTGSPPPPPVLLKWMWKLFTALLNCLISALKYLSLLQEGPPPSHNASTQEPNITHTWFIQRAAAQRWCLLFEIFCKLNPGCFCSVCAFFCRGVIFNNIMTQFKWK